MGTIDINTVNPYIRVAMRSVLPVGTEIKQRVIFDYELIYIEDGECILNYAESNYKFKPGQFILIRPGIPHSFKCIRHDLSQPHIHFDIVYTSNSPETPVSFKDIGQFTQEELWLIQPDIFSDYPVVPYITFSDTSRILNLFYTTIDLSRSGSTLAAKGMLTEIIDMLISDNFPDSLSGNPSDIYNIAHHLKAFIDSGQGINTSLDAFEKQFSYSKFYLERIFKREYGIGLIAYRNNKKMKLACKMLETVTVSDVSETLGFSSIYSFSRAFKNKYGICPSKYKNNLFQEEKQ